MHVAEVPVADFGQINSVSIEHIICRRSSTLVTKLGHEAYVLHKTSAALLCPCSQRHSARILANEWREGYSKWLPPVLDDGDTRAASNSCWREIRLA